MLIETSGSNKNHDEEKLNDFLEHAMETGLVIDGTVTNEPTKMRVNNFANFDFHITIFHNFFSEYLEAPRTNSG